MVGRRSSDAVATTASVIMSSVARCGVGLRFCIASMAERARGVAAFPMPRMLALTAAVIFSLVSGSSQDLFLQSLLGS